MKILILNHCRMRWGNISNTITNNNLNWNSINMNTSINIRILFLFCIIKKEKIFSTIENSKMSSKNISSKPVYVIPKDTAYFVGELFGYYFIPAAGLISFLANATLYHMMYKCNVLMKHRKYRLLLSKTFIVSILSK